LGEGWDEGRFLDCSRIDPPEENSKHKMLAQVYWQKDRNSASRKLSLRGKNRDPNFREVGTQKTQNRVYSIEVG
jgi:hypothetical protein